MLSDHDNLLSTFGKDSESSNRKNRQVDYSVKSKRISLNYGIQPKSRYQQILSQRKTLMMLQKKSQVTQKPKHVTKKFKTESDIDVLNNRIRKSISGIADTICISKQKQNLSSNCKEFNASVSSTKRLSHASKIQSYKDLKSFQSRRLKTAMAEKENINLNVYNFQQSNRQTQKNLSKQQYLKNSTKKKGKFFDSSNDYPIKSSFSIDVNSQSESLFQSSRKQLREKQLSHFDLNINNGRRDSRFSKINNDNHFGKINDNHFSKKSEKRRDSFNKKYPGVKVSIGKEMEETLKKQFKQLAESNYVQLPKFLESNQQKRDKNNRQFLFYEDLETNQEQKSPNFTSIEFPKTYDTQSIKRNFNIKNQNQQKKFHKLIAALMNQIELDYDLRHAKHMFSGIEEPFFADPKNKQSQSKWQRLNQELNNLGLHYSVQTIKKIFLPSQQEIDPFLSVGKPHDQLIYSLIYAYETAEIHWQQNVYNKWHHWDLRDIDLTIENVDRDRKGYITVEDIAAFVSVQAGKQYKNRDLVLIYKRLVNGFKSRRQDQGTQSFYDEKDKNKLKFRSLIDCLIRPF